MRLQEQVFKAYQDQTSSNMEACRKGALAAKEALEHSPTSSNMEACRKGALAAKEALEHSPLYWNGILDKTVHIPKVFRSNTSGRSRPRDTAFSGK